MAVSAGLQASPHQNHRALHEPLALISSNIPIALCHTGSPCKEHICKHQGPGGGTSHSHQNIVQTTSRWRWRIQAVTYQTAAEFFWDFSGTVGNVHVANDQNILFGKAAMRFTHQIKGQGRPPPHLFASGCHGLCALEEWVKQDSIRKTARKSRATVALAATPCTATAL